MLRETETEKMGREKQVRRVRLRLLRSSTHGAFLDALEPSVTIAKEVSSLFLRGDQSLQGSITSLGNYVTLPTASATPPRIL